MVHVVVLGYTGWRGKTDALYKAFDWTPIFSFLILPSLLLLKGHLESQAFHGRTQQGFFSIGWTHSYMAMGCLFFHWLANFFSVYSGNMSNCPLLMFQHCSFCLIGCASLESLHHHFRGSSQVREWETLFTLDVSNSHLVLCFPTLKMTIDIAESITNKAIALE